MSADEQAEQGTPRTDALVSEYIAACAACESDDQEQWAALGEIWFDKLLAKHAALERELSAQRQPVGGEAGEVAYELSIILQYNGDDPQYQQRFLEKAAALIEKMAKQLADAIKFHTAENTDRMKAESELSALKARLDAPCEEVELLVSINPGRINRYREVVPADYARDLYRKWQEAREQLRLADTGWKHAAAELVAQDKKLEAAEQRAAEAVAREREACARICDRAAIDRQCHYECAPCTSGCGNNERWLAAAIRARSEGEGNG